MQDHLIFREKRINESTMDTSKKNNTAAVCTAFAATKVSSAAGVAANLRNETVSMVDGVEEFLCVECGTAEHLEVEEIQTLESGLPGFVMTEYSCGKCEGFYAHEVPVAGLGAFLANTDTPAGVLKFGRHYIHCGEPMMEQEMRLYTLTAPGVRAEELADVVLPGLVLKCSCGFQMSVPH